MAFQKAYQTGCKLSILLFAISLGLPLYMDGEYVGGYTILGLIFHTAPAISVQFELIMRLAAFLLPLFLYGLLSATLSMKLFRYGTRMILFVIFLFSVIAAIAANARLRVIPFGPAAVSLGASMAILIVFYGMSLYDKSRR